jgi:lipoprotein-anchoring transpeptidase ErfK/SrfK
MRPEPLSVDAGKIASPEQPDVDFGNKGSGVVRAQILLARAHFSCGQIDGNFGTNLQKTVLAFQGDRHVPSSGTIDAPTWAALNNDKAPLLISYTITPEDLKGPFVKVPEDLMEQASLPSLGYASPLDELAERFHSSPELLMKLNPGADFGKAGQEFLAPNVLVMPPAPQAARVAVSKSESSIRTYGSDGKLLAFYVATIGSSHDPLPVGEWKITGVRRNPVFHYNAELFWNAPDKSKRAEIRPGPRNPVGLVWMDLSKEHYGIHGTPDASKIGHTFSHGCIRLTNWDALELASMVKPGTPAILKE